ncbi:hypothetical protein D0T50_06460 [Bacteroides sp. 214]|uniref:hypothetical protein n=1 Tax=Bacteroides sp. 214 TaxID=2302935 RepID=UPI0013D8BDDC|nr:hypothetical protein [Bacteroides sp. 214]NDW12531.1 hypothetical protein [Bacteroides sp. 214]
MKQIITLLLLLLPVAGMAQETNPQDTTIHTANYNSEVKEDDGNERYISVSLPFLKNKGTNCHNYFSPHVSGFYLGYNRMGDDFLGFGSANEVDLVASKSWEWGINLFDGALKLSKQFGITSGLGFGYTSYRLDGNRAFVENSNGITLITDAPEDTRYRKSRLRYYHLRLPISVEWQQHFGRKGPLFFSVGAEVEARFWTKSKAVVNGKRETMSKDLNVRPLGINLLLQGGYNDWGFYCRYSTASLFESKKGPELYPYSIGVQWYW